MPSTLRDLSELTAVANDDQLLVSDTSDVINRDKKISRLNLLGSNISGGGSIATGGNSLTIPASGSAVVGTGTAGRISQWSSVNEVAASTLLKSGAGVLTLAAAATATLTVPGTGTAALLEVGQTYTGANIFNNTVTMTNVLSIEPPSIGGVMVSIDAPVGSTTNNIVLRYGGVARAYMWCRAADTAIQMVDTDFGNTPGPHVDIGRNNNPATPAAGYLRFNIMTGGGRMIWVDATGLLRLHTTGPTNATDTAGTIVGSQSSHAAAKHLADELSPLYEVIARVRAGAAAVRRFTYRSGAFNGQEFEGVVTDEAPAYGMDRDTEHPAGKSLNEIQIIGDLLRLVADLQERIYQMEGTL